MALETAVSVVLPAYNEAETLAETVQTTTAALNGTVGTGYEVIVAEDGCTDRTPEIARRLAAERDDVRHVHSDDRLGRGRALTMSFERAGGEVLAYFDTDLATDLRHLEDLLKRVHVDGYDIVTGSRWLPGSEASRPADRETASWAYNRLVRLLLGSQLHDHQCGFKAFRRDALFDVLPAVENGHWFWDTEVLVRAQWRGFDVAEFPVTWEPKGDTKVDLIKDSKRMGGEILRLWWERSVRSLAPAVSRDLPREEGLEDVVDDKP